MNLSVNRFHFFTWLLRISFFVLCLLCVILLVREVRQGIHLETNLQALFPQDANDRVTEQINQRFTQTFNNKILIGVQAKNLEGVTQAAVQLQNAIAAAPFLKIPSQDEAAALLNQQQQLFAQYRYHLLTVQQRDQLQNPSSQAQMFSQAQANLFGLNPVGQMLSPTEDPLGFFPAWTAQLQPAINGELIDGHLLLSQEGVQTIVFPLSLEGETFNSDLQESLSEWLANASDELKKNPVTATTEILVSGIVFHAASAAEHSKSELNWIGAGDIFVSVILFIFTFYRVRPLLLTLTSVGFGFLVAFSFTQFLFQKVHVITLVFGTSLIGVAIDYSVHYLCKHQELFLPTAVSRDEKKSASSYVLQKLLPALSLGLLASIVGYACLLQPALPGLKQIASFSIVGLCSAWLFVVVTFPWWMREALPKPHAWVDACAFAVWRFWVVVGVRGKIIFAFVALAIVTGGATQFSFSHDIKTLYKPTPELMHSEMELQKALQAVSPNQYFLVSAPSVEALLQLEEKFRQESLDPLVTVGALKTYSATSIFTPSENRQEENYALLKQTVFAPHALAEQFMLATEFDSAAIHDAKNKFADAEQKTLSLEEWIKVARVDQQLLWLGEIDNKFVSIIGLQGVKDVASLEVAAKKFSAATHLKDSNIRWVNRVNDMSSLLLGLTGSAATMLALAYLTTLVILLVAYRRWPALLLIGVPLSSTLLGLSLLSWFGVPINLFHIFGCFLILGLGMDYAIFSYNEGLNDKISQRSIWLSAVTGGVSFGLLGFSSMPMVQSFGVIILLGASFNLLFAPWVGHLKSGSFEKVEHLKNA